MLACCLEFESLRGYTRMRGRAIRCRDELFAAVSLTKSAIRSLRVPLFAAVADDARGLILERGLFGVGQAHVCGAAAS
jgi:hypothetical protein